MKGVILAGGLGTRLFPLTKITNKHLLPVYDRPMIYYPIEALVNAGIDDIMIVTGGKKSGDFLSLLEQRRGVRAEAPELHLPGGRGRDRGGARPREHWAGERADLRRARRQHHRAQHQGKAVEDFRAQGKGAKIMLKQVHDPERFGVANARRRQGHLDRREAQGPESDLAVIGIYMYDAPRLRRHQDPRAVRPRRAGDHRREQLVHPRRLDDLRGPRGLVDRRRHVRVSCTSLGEPRRRGRREQARLSSDAATRTVLERETKARPRHRRGRDARQPGAALGRRTATDARRDRPASRPRAARRRRRPASTSPTRPGRGAVRRARALRRRASTARPTRPSTRRRKSPTSLARVNGEALRVLARPARRRTSRSSWCRPTSCSTARRPRPYRRDAIRSRPLSVYGRTKLDGERPLRSRRTRRARASCARSGSTGPGASTSPSTIERAGVATVTSSRSSSDQFGSPTSTLELSPALWDVAAEGARPAIYHAACEGVVPPGTSLAVRGRSCSSGIESVKVPVEPCSTEPSSLARRSAPRPTACSTRRQADRRCAAEVARAVARGPRHAYLGSEDH